MIVPAIVGVVFVTRAVQREQAEADLATVPLPAITQPAQSQHVSLIRLIATPERYHNKPVIVEGYLSLDPRNTALYVSKEFYDLGRLKESIWVNVPVAWWRNREAKLRTGDVLIEGKFDAREAGPLGMFSGGLTDLDGMLALSDRKIMEGYFHGGPK